jgi:hypothetical protein
MRGMPGNAFEYEPLPSMPDPADYTLLIQLGCFRRRPAFELSCGHSVQQNARGSLQSDTIDLDYIGRGRPWICDEQAAGTRCQESCVLG